MTFETDKHRRFTVPAPIKEPLRKEPDYAPLEPEPDYEPERTPTKTPDKEPVPA